MTSQDVVGDNARKDGRGYEFARHSSVYRDQHTPPNSPDMPRVIEPYPRSVRHIKESIAEIREHPLDSATEESLRLINGIQHLPATFPPGPRRGPGLAATLKKPQELCDEQRLAEPVMGRGAED